MRSRSPISTSEPARGRLRASRLAPLLVLLLAACATTTSPTGRTQYVGAVSQAQLDALGAKAFAEQKAGQRLAPPAQQRYVACVTDALARELPPQWRQVPWETAVFVNDEPNAFALPGGKVGVNTGIFRVARTQDELAAVLAHEIGHVIARHHDERITRQLGAAGAVQLLGALAGDYGQLATQGGSLLAQTGFLLPNSRAQEAEADVVGQRLMAEAGFDPRAAVALWRNIEALGGARPPRWLSTHPDPSSRLRELQARADGLLPVWEQARRRGLVPRCG